MRVLVTGSSGFIGTALVRHLAGAGFQVLGIDRAIPPAAPSNYEFQQLDVLDRGQLIQAASSFRPDALIHLAARIDVTRGAPLSGYSCNTVGVENVLAVVRNVPTIRRGIYTSSQLVCRIGHVPATEKEYCPDSTYGESKVLTEKLVREHDGSGREWCLVRPTTVWGPGMNSHYQNFLRLIEKGLYFHIGKRPLIKSFSYIGNIIQQLTRLLQAPALQIHQRVFYLADYEPFSMRDWANEFQIQLNARPIRTYPIFVATFAATLGDCLKRVGIKFPFNSFHLHNMLAEYSYDMTPTRVVCGPLPYDMKGAVRETVAWYRALPSHSRS